MRGANGARARGARQAKRTRRRRRIAPPTIPNPVISMAQTDGSGIGPAPGVGTGGGGTTLPPPGVSLSVGGVPGPGDPPPPPPSEPPPTKIGSPPVGGKGVLPNSPDGGEPGAAAAAWPSVSGTAGAKNSLGKPAGPLVGIAPSGPADVPRTEATAFPGAAPVGPPALAAGVSAERRFLPLSATPPMRAPGDRAASSASAVLPPTAFDRPWGTSVANKSAAVEIASVTPATLRFLMMRPAVLRRAVI